jgi:hypothetical protein
MKVGVDIALTEGLNLILLHRVRGYMELLHLEVLRLLEQAMQRLMPGAVLHFYIHIR